MVIRTRAHQWAFSYVPGEDDDEPIFRFDSHVFAPGEYATITEHDGDDYVFKVIFVPDVPAPPAQGQL